MGMTSVFVWAVFFPAAFLTTFIVLPFPQFVNKPISKLVERALLRRVPFLVPGGVSIIVLLTCCSFMNWAWASLDLSRKAGYLSTAHRTGFGNFSDLKAMNFRAERNWWISLFSLSLYAIQWRVRSAIQELSRIRLQLQAAKSDLVQSHTNLREQDDKLKRLRDVVDSIRVSSRHNQGQGQAEKDSSLSSSMYLRPAPRPSPTRYGGSTPPAKCEEEEVMFSREGLSGKVTGGDFEEGEAPFSMEQECERSARDRKGQGVRKRATPALEAMRREAEQQAAQQTGEREQAGVPVPMTAAIHTWGM